jgi:hypothetical protein
MAGPFKIATANITDLGSDIKQSGPSVPYARNGTEDTIITLLSSMYNALTINTHYATEIIHGKGGFGKVVLIYG